MNENVNVFNNSLAQIKRALYGREVIFADYSEEDMNEETIKQILDSKFRIHNKNYNDILYLEDYYKGKQDIRFKKKKYRNDINNKICENNSYFSVEFKKGYVFGDPIQYVQRGDIANPEITELNSYMIAEDKYSKDTELAESIYTCGVGYRIILPNNNEDSPFEIENLDAKSTFIVYSSGLGHKKLFACTYIVDDNKNIKGSIYTKNGFYTFCKSRGNTIFDVKYIKNHILGEIPIVEYYFNKSRLGIIEIVLDLYDTINKIDSNDLDGFDQFIQSILVFVNAEIDKDTFDSIMEMGAVQLNSSENKPADIKNINNKIEHNNTKILHDRLFNQAMTIIGIPKMEDKASGGDTGQARLLGEGWTMADERAKQDEMAFKKCSKPELKLILRICKLIPNSGIRNLTIKDIEQKFTRNKSDNFLVKSQGMMNQIQSGIAPEVAISTSGLYSDSNEVYNKSMEFYGGIENWIKSFVKDNSNKLNENEKIKEQPLENK